MSAPDDYERWLAAEDKAAQYQAEATRRVIDNHQRQAELTIANIGALHELDTDKLATLILGNLT